METNFSLTDREKDILEWMLTEGLSNRELAETLGVSEQAIKNSLHRIYLKLGISNSRQMFPRLNEIRTRVFGESDPVVTA